MKTLRALDRMLTAALIVVTSLEIAVLLTKKTSKRSYISRPIYDD